MTIHSSSRSSNLVLGLIQTPITFLRPPRWKMEVLEEDMISRDNNCRPSLLAVFLDHRLRETAFYPLIH
jgi:hypothetical protein